MRELERDLPATASDATPSAPAARGSVNERRKSRSKHVPVVGALVVVGPGRAGSSLSAAARAGGMRVWLLGRGEDVPVADPAGTAVLLCVPDTAIAEACEAIAPTLPAGTAVGHVSGATSLAALDPAAARGCPVFSLHPLQTIPAPDTSLAGAPCAVAGSDEPSLTLASGLATELGMHPFAVREDARAAYHAAACMASNYLVTLEESAAQLLSAAGVAEPRKILAPLVLRTAANWADAGADALTGPIARGDRATVADHVRALAERAPQLEPLYEALAERTQVLAEHGEGI